MNKYDYDSLTEQEIRQLSVRVRKQMNACINHRLGSLREKQAIIMEGETRNETKISTTI